MAKTFQAKLVLGPRGSSRMREVRVRLPEDPRQMQAALPSHIAQHAGPDDDYIGVLYKGRWVD